MAFVKSSGETQALTTPVYTLRLEIGFNTALRASLSVARLCQQMRPRLNRLADPYRSWEQGDQRWAEGIGGKEEIGEG